LNFDLTLTSLEEPPQRESRAMLGCTLQYIQNLLHKEVRVIQRCAEGQSPFAEVYGGCSLASFRISLKEGAGTYPC